MNRSIIAIAALSVLGLSAGAARSRDVFDPDYLRIFAQRPALIRSGQKYWLFEPNDIGGHIGCYRWGCYHDGKPLMGQRVVMLGRLQFPLSGADKASLFQVGPEQMAGVLGVFTGHPPALARAPVPIAKTIIAGTNRYNCGGNFSFCKAVIWGTVNYSAQSHGIPGFRGQPYYYIAVQGVRLFGRYDVGDAAKEGATLGWSKGLSLIADAGFGPGH